MGKRYVPKTYKNRRVLRIIFGTILTVTVAAIVIFLLLFFVLENYWGDEQLELPWVAEDSVTD